MANNDSLVVDSAAGITSEWIARILEPHQLGIEPRSVESKPLGTGQMGSTFRVAVQTDAAPLSLIVKLPANPGAEGAATLGQRCEVGFYREAAARVSIPIPHCYFAHQRDEGRHFTIVLADASPAVPGDQIAGCTVEQARAAAVAVAGLHAPTWCDPAIEDFEWLTNARLDEEGGAFFAALLEEATEAYIDTMSPPDVAADTLRRFAERSVRWAVDRRTPFALTHGDYRLDNILWVNPDAPGDGLLAIDWGVVSSAVPQADVALLVAPGLDPDTRRVVERDIVGAYHQRLCELGVTDYDADACWEDYRHGLFHTLRTVALGWRYSTRTERGDRMFKLMLDRSVSAINDNDAFDTI